MGSTDVRLLSVADLPEAERASDVTFIDADRRDQVSKP